MPQSIVLLKRLEALRLSYGGVAATRKRRLLEQLRVRRFNSTKAVMRYHEVLCWLAAYPDDSAILALVRTELTAFARRADLARFRVDLVNSGIAGTAIHYKFFWMMARWLLEEMPQRLVLDWDGSDFEPRLRAVLPLMLGWNQAEAARRAAFALRTLIDHVRGTESDAVFVLNAIANLPGDTFTREHLHDAIDPAYTLQPAAGFPSRTTAHHQRAPLVYRTAPPPAARPDLVQELARAPLGRRVADVLEARELTALAREAILCRERDLAAFSWGDERDVLMIDDGDGLSFVVIGTIPERRLPLPAVHGWLMLRNRVPVGYVQTDSLLNGTEMAFNVFPSFRSGEAGYLFARVLAASRWLLGAQAFSIEPYQLGSGNDEAIESGAWWFYYKMGFRPLAADVGRLAAHEMARRRSHPSCRSTPATLRRLAAGHLVFEPTRTHRAWLPWMPGLGLAVKAVPEFFASEAAADLLNARGVARWTANERLAWQRFAPFVLALHGVKRWPADEKAAAVAAIRAKGGRRELSYLLQFDRHARLRSGLQTLLSGTLPVK